MRTAAHRRHSILDASLCPDPETRAVTGSFCRWQGASVPRPIASQSAKSIIGGGGDEHEPKLPQRCLTEWVGDLRRQMRKAGISRAVANSFVAMDSGLACRRIRRSIEDGREVDVAAIYKTVAEHVEKMKDDPEYKK